MIDLVLVHGFMQDGRIWRDTADALARTAQVHAPDLPGSGTAAMAPLPATVDELADALQSYLQERQLRSFVLVGLSMGGYATLAWWRRHGRATPPLGLVFADTMAVADSPAMKSMRDALIHIVRKSGTSAAVSIVEPTMWGPSASGQAREAMRRNMLEQLPEALVAGLQVMRDRPDSTPLLASIDVPTLVFGGTADAITPYPSMAALAEGLPRCEAAWLDGAGHLACFERPAEFHALLERFVRTVAPAR